MSVSSINPLKVKVNNKSKHAEVYVWDWGDGQHTAKSEPKYHKYNEQGEYTITLTAQSKSGTQDYMCKTFTL
jgi:PKD repeat protein